MQYASSPLSSDTITVTESGSSTHDIVVIAFGVSGANTAAPFDTHNGLPYPSKEPQAHQK